MTNSAPSRILIVEDHPLAREGLALAVRGAFPGCAVISAGTIEQALNAVARHRSDLILLDFKLPDAHGFAGFLQLQHAAGNVPIALISAYKDAQVSETARALGAIACISKLLNFDRLTDELRRIGTGQPGWSDEAESISDITEMNARFASLTGSQRAVLRGLASGALNKQIAHDLGVSEATVKSHLTNIFRKLGVRNRAQALVAMRPLMGDLS